MNPFEQAARQAKVDRLVAFLWDEVLTTENKVDPETVWTLRRMNQKAWDLLAGEAKVNSPSEVTQREVIRIITQRVRDARWGFHRGREVA